MKRYFWKRVGYSAGLMAVLLLAGCEAKTATEQTPATAAYICPMGCEGSASDKPGKCPVCQMELEPNPAAKPAAQL